MALALRLNIKGPRRLTFRKVVPAIKITYGEIVPISGDDLAKLKESDPLFVHNVKNGALEVLEGSSDETVEREAKAKYSEEVNKPLPPASESWSTNEKTDDGLPMIKVPDERIAEKEETAAKASTRKVREKTAKAAAHDKAKAKAKG